MRTCDVCGRDVPHPDLVAAKTMKVATVVNVSGTPVEFVDRCEIAPGYDVCVRCAARGIRAQGRELRLSATARRRLEAWEKQIAEENAAPMLPME